MSDLAFVWSVSLVFKESLVVDRMLSSAALLSIRDIVGFTSGKKAVENNRLCPTLKYAIWPNL